MTGTWVMRGRVQCEEGSGDSAGTVMQDDREGLRLVQNGLERPL